MVDGQAAYFRGKTLAIGFGVTVAMWVLGYISLMQPGRIVGEGLFILTAGCLVAGGFIAGRGRGPNESPWWAGLKVALVSATLNMLLIGGLIGSLSGGDSPRQRALRALMWTGGMYLASAALAIIGSIAGAARTARRGSQELVPPPRNWFNAFTCVAAVTVFLLLITGGLVTGLEAGLAVPDWPNSFGHNMLLYPLGEMISQASLEHGVHYEHVHRLYGMLVGVTAITVAISLFIFEDRPWLKALGIVFLLMVCAQGVVGGTRVTETSRTLAIIHGMFGQIVFATIVAIAAFTSTTWKSDLRPMITRSASSDRGLSALLPFLLIVQLALGALYRHLRRELKNPPEPLHLLYTHMVVALLVTVLILIVAGRAWSVHRDRPVLPVLGKVVLCLVGGQLMLGVSATIAVWARSAEAPVPVIEVVVTTAHQATGALLLAMATLMMLWTRRLLKPEK